MLSYRILCTGRCERSSERHDRCDAGGGKLQPPPPASVLPPPTATDHRCGGGVLVGPCGAGEARGVGPGGETRVLAAGPTPALPPWRASAQYTPTAANRDCPLHRAALRAAAVGVRAVDTAMIPPPPTPASHPPSRCCGVLRVGGFVCARTYRRRPRNTGAAAGILSISPSGATTRRTNFLTLPAHRNVPGGAQSDPNAPASRAATATYNTVSHDARMVATTPSTTPARHCHGTANNKEAGGGRRRETVR